MKYICNRLFVFLFICVCLISCREGARSTGGKILYIEWLETGRVDTLEAPWCHITWSGDMVCVRGETSVWPKSTRLWEHCYPVAKVMISRDKQLPDNKEDTDKP